MQARLQNGENVQIFPSSGFFGLFYQYSHKRSLLLNLSSSVSVFTDEKVWLLMYLILLPHIPVLLMMSLIQAAWHKMAAPMVMF